MYLNIALPKGRLGDVSYQKLKEIGYSCNDFEKPSRKLIFENKELKLRFFLVKAVDVPIYVQRGVADVGIVGKDVLLENEAIVLEMLDLKIGHCRFAVAAKQDYVDDETKKVIVATKYIEVANEYFKKRNREIELVKLNGSVELAPLVNMSDVIVDLVETGNTLKENNLKIIDEFYDVSGRLVVNEASYRFKRDTIKNLIDGLKTNV